VADSGERGGGRPPLIDLTNFCIGLNVKGNPRMHQNQPFQAKNSIFLGRGHSLLPRPLPSTVRPIIKFWIRHCLYSPWWHSSLGRKNQRLFSINRPIRKPGQLHWQCFPNMPIFSDRPKKTPKNPTPEIIFSWGKWPWWEILREKITPGHFKRYKVSHWRRNQAPLMNKTFPS